MNFYLLFWLLYFKDSVNNSNQMNEKTSTRHVMTKSFNLSLHSNHLVVWTTFFALCSFIPTVGTLFRIFCFTYIYLNTIVFWPDSFRVTHWRQLLALYILWPVFVSNTCLRLNLNDQSILDKISTIQLNFKPSFPISVPTMCLVHFMLILSSYKYLCLSIR